MSIKELFEQLMSQVDPDSNFISEEKKIDLINSFEEKISEIKEQAFGDALKTIDEEHTNKLQNVIDIIEEMDNDHAAKLSEIIENIDEDHAAKLSEIIENIDEDHASQLENVLEKVDEEHTDKLNKIIEMYENNQNVDLVENINNYLDVYLEDVKPINNVVNEVRLDTLEETISQLRNVLMVTDDYVQTEVKEALLDAHNIIEEKDKEVNRLMLEKVETVKQRNITEATIRDEVVKLETEKLLESKMSGCSPKLQAYLELCFENVCKEDIEEKFDEAVLAFKQTEDEKRQVIIEKHEKLSNDRVVPATVITEGRFEDKSLETQQMNIYANMVNKTTKSMK